MTQLENLANLGELISAAAVVISLVYLAIQIRQSTKAQQMENYGRALDRIATLQSMLSQDGEMAVIFSRAVRDPQASTRQERLQLTWHLYELFGALEFVYLANRSQSIPQEVWNRWSMTCAYWLSFAGVQAWWQARPIPFSESFANFIDGQLANNPVDRDARSRFNDFIGSDSDKRD